MGSLGIRLDDIYRKSETIMRLKGFMEWGELSPINENVQESKKFIKKYYADNVLKKPLPEMNDSDINRALNNVNYKAIVDLTRTKPGYTLPFVRFFFDQGIRNLQIPGPEEEIRSLKQLFDWIDNRKQLISRLPLSIEEYSKKKIIDGVSGFEKLADDIRTLEREISLKWIVDAIPLKPREEFRKLPDDKKREFLNLGRRLEDLDKGDIKKTITTRLLDKISAMSNYSIFDIINYVSNYVKGYQDVDLKKMLDNIIEISPEAGILYNKYPYLVLSMRTENSQKKLCSIANWCINRGAFQSYVSDAIQINIFNYELPAQDRMFLTGTTIGYNGEIKASHDINDKNLFNLSNNTPRNHFEKIGYPKNMVDSVVSEIPTEIVVKKLIADSYKINKKLSFFTSLLNLTENKLMGSFNDAQWANVIKIILEILKNHDNHLYNKIVGFIKENGVLTIHGAILLNDFLREKLSDNEIDEIYKSSNETFDEINRLYVYYKSEGEISQAQELKKILDNKQKVLSMINPV